MDIEYVVYYDMDEVGKHVGIAAAREIYGGWVAKATVVGWGEKQFTAFGQSKKQAIKRLEIQTRDYQQAVTTRQSTFMRGGFKI